MIGSSKEIAVAIPLKVWQDPQGNPLLIFSEHLCEIFVGCWEDVGTPADYICKIAFNSAWAGRSFTLEFLSYEIKEDKHSAIFEVINSNWLKESSQFRLKYYPEWKNWDEKIYRHFVVQGHDKFVEILAESYEVETILLEKAKRFLPSKYLEFFNQ